MIGICELPPKNWTGGEGALRPTFYQKEVWYNVYGMVRPEAMIEEVCLWPN